MTIQCGYVAQSFRNGILGRSLFSFAGKVNGIDYAGELIFKRPRLRIVRSWSSCLDREITFLAMFLSGVQSLRIFRLIFSRVSIVGRTPLPLKRHREQAGPGHFVMSLLTAYLVAHAPCSTALIDAIAAERVPKPKEREHGT